MAGIGGMWQRDPSRSRAEHGALRAIAAVTAVGLAFLVSRCAASSTASAKRDDGAAAGAQAVTDIDALLAKRSAALLKQDRAAYLATDADTAWRGTDAAMFDNLRAVPFSSWQMTVDRESTVAGTYEIKQSYQLGGVDPVPVATVQYLSFVSRNGTWLVSSGADDKAHGIVSDVELWDEGPVTLVKGTRSVVLGLGGTDRLTPFATLADQAVAKDSKIWGPAGWTGTVLLEVPATQAQLEELLKSDAGQFAGVAAVTTGEIGAAASSAHADRVLVNPDVWETLSPSGRQVVIEHELTHVQTRRWTTAATPMWVSEGAADYTGYLGSVIPTPKIVEELKEDISAGHKPDALPTDAQFHADSGAALSVDYEKSWLACRLIAETYGQAKLVDFYKAISLATAPADAVDQAFRTVLKTTPEAFTAKWRQYVLTTAAHS